MAGETALVLFSGGQDSTTCLAWALERFDAVETVAFDYGQRHHVELDCRTRILDRLKAEFAPWSAKIGPDHLIDLGFLSAISDTALTRETEIAIAENGLPTTFVPGRNLLFLTAAAALAYRRGIQVLVGGMCETDFSGYPDCRRATIDAMESALTQGMAMDLRVETPLMQIDKAATWALSAQLGGETLIDLILEETHTCYLGDRTHRHVWGYGCGSCFACELRSAGYARFREAA